jgi:ABC-2 type transport system ATP-binding protein
MPPAIELHDISKTFAEHNWKTILSQKPRFTKALDHVSLTVQKGKIMGLLGPNGAGKTTLIKILATLVTPDTGNCSIAGLSLKTHSSAIRNKIGLVNTNDRSFYWRLTGRDNLEFFAALYNLSEPVKNKRIKQVLQLINMDDKADFRFASYSAGQKQRLSIARAMLANPEILLLDEASASLDPIASRKLLDFTKNVLVQKENKTIIWCTHNLYEADQICDHLTILHQGKILHSGSKKFIKTLLERKTLYTISVNILHDEIKRQSGFKLVSQDTTGTFNCRISIRRDNIPELIQKLTSDGVKIYECSSSPSTQPLEKIFSQLIYPKSQGTAT